MKPRILTSFGGYTDADLKEKAAYILACMTDNENFTTPEWLHAGENPPVRGDTNQGKGKTTFMEDFYFRIFRG